MILIADQPGIIQVLDPLVLYKKLPIISPMVSPAHIPSHHPIIPATSSPTVASERGRTNVDRWLCGMLWWGPAIREVWFVSGKAVQHYLVVSPYLEHILVKWDHFTPRRGGEKNKINRHLNPFILMVQNSNEPLNQSIGRQSHCWDRILYSPGCYKLTDAFPENRCD